MTTPTSAQRSGWRRWWVPLLVVSGLLSLLLLLLTLIGVTTVLRRFESAFQTAELPKGRSFLLLELTDLPEWQPGALLPSGAKPTLWQALAALRFAREDEDVAGLYLRLGATQLGWAKLAELGAAIDSFRAAGKPVYAYLEVGAERDYAIALHADSIFMPREGLLELSGFAATGLFWTELLDKLGIRYHVEQFEEYKSAGEPFVRRSFSPAARQNLQELLAERYRAFVELVSQRRGISEERLRTLFSQALHTADSLLAQGLIDGVLYESELLARLARRIGRKDTLAEQVRRSFFPIAAYAERALEKRSSRRYPAIAVVYAVGGIVPGRGRDFPFSGPVVASEDFIPELQRAAADEEVGAIILRIDSPGGSVLASDAIWTELRRIAQRKPVYASMSDVAASGGYYLAMGCDTIVAEKQSLTGSIGVIIAIPNLSGTAGKLGIAVDTVQSNPGALFLSPLLPFAPAQLERLHRLGEQFYRNFLTRVAQRRGMHPDSLRPIAKGRVWSGHAAYRLGLVDTLGGLQTAIALAQRRLGIPSERFPRIKEFPRRKDLLELLLEQFSATERSAAMPELVRLLPPALQRKLEQAVLLWKLSWSEPILALLPPELLP